MIDVDSSPAVLVTGGNGYLAGWMIVGLLERGYRVRTTFRNLRQQADLSDAIGAQVGELAGRLSFMQADLLSDAGWDDATRGCRYVIHTASPMGHRAPAGVDLVGPARDGTLRVLGAAARSKVERVVCTSSGFAAQAPTVPGVEQPLADESVWTDLTEKGTSEYMRSKVLAERAAWQFMRSEQTGMSLTTILPGLIVGELMKRSVPPSLQVIEKLLSGTIPAMPRVGFTLSEVRTLVDLHIRAMTHPSAANQRFNAMADFVWIDEICDILRQEFPDRAARIPRKRLPDWVIRIAALFQAEARVMAPMLGKRRAYDAGKADKLLQWRATPSKQAVILCARSLLRAELVPAGA